MVDAILLLAAGDGTRFWPLTEKNLVSFNGKSLLQEQLERVADQAKRIIIVCNDTNKSAIESIAKDVTNVTILVQEKVEDGQGGAILTAKAELTGDVLVMNANDIFEKQAIVMLIKEAKNRHARAAFLAKKVTSYFPGGYVSLNNGTVTGIVEKPVPEAVPSDLVKLVVDYYSDAKELVTALESTSAKHDDWYEQGLNKVIASGNVHAVSYEGFWTSIKYPWNILTAMQYFLAVTQPNIRMATVHKTAIIEGNVYLGKNVTVGAHAKVVGPCFIDDNVIVGDYSMVRESMVGRDSLIGGYCEVTRSYIGNNVMLHRDYVGDSVLADSVLMGAGAITANFRFDQGSVPSIINEKKVDSGLPKFGAIIGKGAKIGVHCTITPGVKVGRNTFVGPHELIDRDLPDNKFLYKGELKENKK